MNCALYEFFRDQGSIIAGLLALCAGAALYVIGRRQVRATKDAAEQQVAAVNRQNAFLRRSEKRRLARETLVAARLFGGVIATLMVSMATKTPANPIDVRLENIPLYEIVDHLGKLSRESIDGYYLLSRKITEFRTAGTRDQRTGGQLTLQLDALKRVAKHVEDQIAEDSKKAQAVLDDTQDA